MRPVITLPDPLAELCDDVCSRCGTVTFEPAPLGALVEAAPDEYREVVRHWLAHLPNPDCGCCDFLHLLRALRDLVPVADLEVWLRKPNVDLKARTPLACIHAGEYDAVFRALWVRSPADGEGG